MPLRQFCLILLFMLIVISCATISKIRYDAFAQKTSIVQYIGYHNSWFSYGNIRLYSVFDHRKKTSSIQIVAYITHNRIPKDIIMLFEDGKEIQNYKREYLGVTNSYVPQYLYYFLIDESLVDYLLQFNTANKRKIPIRIWNIDAYLYFDFISQFKTNYIKVKREVFSQPDEQKNNNLVF